MTDWSCLRFPTRFTSTDAYWRIHPLAAQRRVAPAFPPTVQPGDITYLTVQCGDRFVEVKRDFRSPLGVPLAVGFDPDRLYFFDSEFGARLR